MCKAYSWLGVKKFLELLIEPLFCLKPKNYDIEANQNLYTNLTIKKNRGAICSLRIHVNGYLKKFAQSEQTKGVEQNLSFALACLIFHVLFLNF